MIILVKYNLWEVVTLDDNLNQNGALRVMIYKSVFQNSLSVYLGAIKTKTIDIHTLSDISLINK